MPPQFATLNNTQFHYELAGAGPPLVLVHAGIADGRMWDEQFDVFAQRYQVLRYDRRGFGRTPMVAGSYSHQHDLLALLQYLRMARAYFIGCSQGAKTIVDLALEHPAMTAALVLVAPALSGFVFTGEPPRQAQRLDDAENAGDLALVNELELQIWVDGPHRTPAQVDARVRERVRAMNRIALQTPENLGQEQPLVPSAAQRLHEIHTPTLVITGDLDTPRTLATAAYLAQHIAGAQSFTLPNTAHLPNLEQPAEFNRQVLTFLSRLG